MTKQPEVVVPWFNASNANDQSCVDVQLLDDGTVQNRNSKRTEIVTAYTPKEWATFIDAVKAGKFDHTVI